MRETEPVPVPVRRSPDGRVLWRGEAVCLDHFPEIRKYCDACLKHDPDGTEFRLTRDWEMLARLILQVDQAIPWFTPEEAIQALQRIPDPPPPYRRTGAPPSWGKNWVEKRKKWLANEAASKRKAEEALQAYRSWLPAWKSRHEIWKRIQQIISNHKFQKHAVERLGKELSKRMASGDSIMVHEVAWEILPPGEALWPELLESMTRSHRASVGFEPERLRKICSLNPEEAYRGLGDFDGYVVFLFDGARAVLECPKVGNAVYLLTGNWKVLCRLTKAELLSRHSGNARRVIHREGNGWLDEVRVFALAGR